MLSVGGNRRLSTWQNHWRGRSTVRTQATAGIETPAQPLLEIIGQPGRDGLRRMQVDAWILAEVHRLEAVATRGRVLDQPFGFTQRIVDNQAEAPAFKLQDAHAGAWIE